MSSTTVTFATVRIIALLQTIEALADNDNEKITWHCRKELKGSQNTANQPHPVSCPTISWLTWALLMRRWRGAFNFGSNIPKMLTSDSDDDDVLYVREGIPEENTLFFWHCPNWGAPQSQSVLGSFCNSYLPQTQCIPTKLWFFGGQFHKWPWANWLLSK